MTIPKRSAKILLGTFGIFLLFLFFLILKNSQSLNQTSSSLTLQADVNKFKVNFNIHQNDQDEFSQIASKLNLPQGAREGFEFSLDPTTQVKLSFILPTQAKLALTSNEINFQGSTTRRPTEKEFPVENLKIPKNTNLAVAASDFKEFIKSRLSPPPEFASWIDNNLAQAGQYLIIFGSNPDVAVIFRNDNIDFEGLKNIQIAGEPIYFKETRQGIDYHVIKLPEENLPRTLTFFRENQYIFFVSSYEAAQELSSSKQEDSAQFPNLPTGQLITLAILFQNYQSSPTSNNFYKLLLRENKLSEILQNIDKIEFVLKEDQFSGLINIK